MPRGLNPVAVWAVLVAATGVSWWLGADHAGTAVAFAVVAVAFAKVWLIGSTFMELGNAPGFLRRAFAGYVVVVPASLFLVYLVT